MSNLEQEVYIQKNNASKKRYNDLTAKVNILRAEAAKEHQQALLIENECKAKEGHICVLSKTQSEARDLIPDLKAENSKLKDEIGQRTIQLEQSLADRQRLQGQIVNSPDRFRRQITDVAQTLQSEQVIYHVFSSW